MADRTRYSQHLRVVGSIKIDAMADAGSQIDGVIDAIHANFPGTVWRKEDKPHQFRSDGTLVPLSVGRFRELALRSCVFTAIAAKGLEEERKPDARIVSAAYHSENLADDIRGVRMSPWIDLDGTLHTEPGLHEGGWLLHLEGAQPDPDSVTDDDVADVLARLTDFEFKTEADRVHYIALLLRAVLPMSGAPQPMTLIAANSRNSGKSLAAKVFGELLLGKAPEGLTLPQGTESQYTLGAWLRAGLPLIWIDNAPTGEEVGDGGLDGALTSCSSMLTRNVGEKGLGGGNPTDSVWVMTGNQIELRADLGRRVVPVNLQRRRPGRAFLTEDLHTGWVLRNRARILSCLLRMVRSWIDAGAEPPPRTLDTFEVWAYRVGGVVCHAIEGARDVWLAPESRPIPADERMWHDLFQTVWPRDDEGVHRWVTCKELYACLDDEIPALQVQLGAGSEKSRHTRLALAMGRQVKRDALDPIAGLWRLDKERDRSANVSVYRPTVHPNATRNLRDPREVGTGSRDLPADSIAEVSEVPAPIPPPPPYFSTTASSSQKGPGGPGGPDNPSNTTYYNPPTSRRGPGEVPVGRSRGVLRESLDEDTGRPQIAAMASRGLLVDQALWAQRYRAYVDALTPPQTQREEDQLRAASSYGPLVLARAAGDSEGRVGCEWSRQAASRIQTNEPNLQGISKSGGLRECFKAPDGMQLIVADFISSHLWVIAGLSGDEKLWATLCDRDVYVDAVPIWAPDIEDPAQARKAAKRAIVATLNGCGGALLAVHLGQLGATVDAAEAARRRDAWIGAYPQMCEWIKATRKARRATLPTGRVVELPARERSYKAVAFALQEAEGDALREVLRRYTGRIVLTVHDEVVAEEDSEHAETMAALLSALMHEALMTAVGRDADDAPTSRTVDADVRGAWGKG